MYLFPQFSASARNIKRLFWGAGTFKSTAIDFEVLCPEEHGESYPSIYLDGQLEKITAAARGTDLAAQIRPVLAREVIHAPTIAYHLRNATLWRGSIYSGALRHFLYDTPVKTPSVAPIYLKQAALTSTMLGTEYFGHWLKDDCCQYLLAAGRRVVCVPPLYTPFHRAQYELYFQQDWTPTACAHISDLIVYQDYSQNSLKRARYQILRDRIRSRLKPTDTSLIYLKRGQTGVSRPVANEDEIVNVLTKAGFGIVDIVSNSLEEIISSLMDATIVVTVEGSHFWHCWFSAEKRSGVVTLQPPDRFTSIAKGWLDASSARFGLVVGDKVPEGSRFSISDILKTVDLMIADLARHPG